MGAKLGAAVTCVVPSLAIMLQECPRRPYYKLAPCHRSSCSAFVRVHLAWMLNGHLRPERVSARAAHALWSDFYIYVYIYIFNY